MRAHEPSHSGAAVAAKTRLTKGDRIVIVGGGVIGVSLAFHLAELGHPDVVLVERAGLGEGTTSKATGGIRQQFTSQVNAGLVHRSVQLFQELEDRTGSPFVFRQHGYLFLLKSEQSRDAFATGVAMQQRLGIDARMITPDEIADLMPIVRVDDLVAGSYCPTDGSASPHDALAAYASAARRRGVRFFQHTTVHDIRLSSSGEVQGVDTSAGFMEAEIVVIAAGPQSRDVGRMAGVELPVAPHRRQAFTVGRADWMHAGLPLTVDIATGSYVHVEAYGGAVVGGNDRDVPEGTDTSVNTDLVENLVEALTDRFPAMGEAVMGRGWAGLREMTPDDHALVGPVSAVPGLWTASGFSGHGFMQAPAIGESLSQLMLRGLSQIDLGPLRPERFIAGALIGESVVF